MIAANEDGVWNAAGASLDFRLGPYFRRTPWFYAIAIGALILLGVVINVLCERHRRVRHQASHNPLTWLPNRLLLDARAVEAMANGSRDSCKIGVLYLDLDGFKRVNDTLGHVAGDALLQIVAARFRAWLRQSNRLARIGGDEFAVLVGGLANPNDAAETASRLIEAFRRPVVVDGHPATLGVSIGIAIHPSDGAEMKTILRAADEAMYRAKLSG